MILGKSCAEIELGLGELRRGARSLLLQSFSSTSSRVLPLMCCSLLFCWVVPLWPIWSIVWRALPSRLSMEKVLKLRWMPCRVEGCQRKLPPTRTLLKSTQGGESPSDFDSALVSKARGRTNLQLTAPTSLNSFAWSNS